MPEISEKSLQTLRSYLEDHAADIADSANDFGNLKEVYQELCQYKRFIGFDEAKSKRIAKMLSNAINTD